MLKFLKVLLICIGVALVVAAVIIMILMAIIPVNHLVQMVNAIPTDTHTANPWRWILIGVLGGIGGGTVLGIGIGLPRHTFRQRLDAQVEKEVHHTAMMQAASASLDPQAAPPAPQHHQASTVIAPSHTPSAAPAAPQPEIPLHNIKPDPDARAPEQH